MGLVEMTVPSGKEGVQEGERKKRNFDIAFLTGQNENETEVKTNKKFISTPNEEFIRPARSSFTPSPSFSPNESHKSSLISRHDVPLNLRGKHSKHTKRPKEESPLELKPKIRDSEPDLHPLYIPHQSLDVPTITSSSFTLFPPTTAHSKFPPQSHPNFHSPYHPLKFDKDLIYPKPRLMNGPINFPEPYGIIPYPYTNLIIPHHQSMEIHQTRLHLHQQFSPPVTNGNNNNNNNSSGGSSNGSTGSAGTNNLNPTTLLPPSLTSLTLPAQNVCAKCNIGFRMTSDLVYHMRSHHKRDSDPQKKKREEKLKCPVCHETFRERHHLTRHMTAHQDRAEEIEHQKQMNLI